MKVAIVGGIGTGKSAVMKIFESLGARTVYADKVNRELFEENEYVDLISASFENVVFDGKVDKIALRNLIINDEYSRLKLNSIAHPRIIERIIELTNIDDICFVEIPLFSVVSNAIKFDKICFVTAPIEIREQRIRLRDKVSSDDAKKIINSQKTEDDIIFTADFIIVNDGDCTKLRAQVLKVFEECLIG